MLMNHIKKLTDTRKEEVKVFKLQNFKLYANKEKSTIVVSQEPLLINYIGWECVIEEKLLQ
jgi:hypothetical protein